MTNRQSHVTIRGLAALRGMPPDDWGPATNFMRPACLLLGAIRQAEPRWVSLRQVRLFQLGQHIDLPTCPACSVLWDEAVSAVAPSTLEGSST